MNACMSPDKIVQLFKQGLSITSLTKIYAGVGGGMKKEEAREAVEQILYRNWMEELKAGEKRKQWEN